MSKITFRADDDLIHRLESFDASKSAVMREALQEYLEGDAESAQTVRKQPTGRGSSLDDIVAERVDALIGERLDERGTPTAPPDVNVNITLEGTDADSADVSDETSPDRKTVQRKSARRSGTTRKTCSGCGEIVDSGHVYCPNCGEKTSKPFCECGEELRSDWAFCPTCGARTPAADVLDNP